MVWYDEYKASTSVRDTQVSLWNNRFYASLYRQIVSIHNIMRLITKFCFWSAVV